MRTPVPQAYEAGPGRFILEEVWDVEWGLAIYFATYLGLTYLFGSEWGAKSYEETKRELVRDLMQRTRKAGRE